MRSSSSDNVFSTIHPIDQGEGGERRASAPRVQVVRGDQELQRGGAEETGRAAAAEAAQDAGSVHASVPVAAAEAGRADVVVVLASRAEAGRGCGSGCDCAEAGGRGCHAGVPEEGGQGAAGLLQAEEARGGGSGTLLWVLAEE